MSNKNVSKAIYDAVKRQTIVKKPNISNGAKISSTVIFSAIKIQNMNE